MAAQARLDITANTSKARASMNQLRNELKAIGHDAHLAGRALGEHTVGKFARLGGLLAGGGSLLGVGLTVGALGVEKIVHAIENANDKWKEQIKLVDDLSIKYGVARSAVQDYLKTFNDNTRIRPSENKEDFERRLHEQPTKELELVQKAIKESLKEGGGSRLEAFKKLGISESTLRTPGNETTIAGILKSAGAGRIGDITKALGSASEAQSFVGVEEFKNKGKYNRASEVALENRREEMRTTAQIAEFEERVAEQAEKVEKVKEETASKEDRLLGILNDQLELESLLTEEGKTQKQLKADQLTYQEKFLLLEEKRIRLQREIDEEQKRNTKETKDAQEKNQESLLGNEEKFGVLKQKIEEAKQEESKAPNGKEKHEAEMRRIHLEGELNALTDRKARTQFHLDTEAKQKVFAMEASEFGQRAKGHALVGGFGGLGARGTGDIHGLGETNSILKMIHAVLLKRYQETTYAKDLFSLH